MMPREPPEHCALIQCPYGCGAVFEKRWEAKRHTKRARCVKAESLSEDKRLSALALIRKPLKQQPFCGVCGIELKAHKGFQAHNATAAHLAKLREATQVDGPSGNGIADAKEPEEWKNAMSKQEVSGSFGSACPDIKAARPRPTTSNEDWETLILSSKRANRGEDGEGAKKKSARERERVTCECGSSYRAGEGKAHLGTLKHRAWAQEEADRAQRATEEREREGMAKEDTQVKHIYLFDTKTSSLQPFKLYKDAEAYKSDPDKQLKEWLAPGTISGQDRDADALSDEEMVSAEVKACEEKFDPSWVEEGAVRLIQHEFRGLLELDTTEMSREQTNHVKRNYEHRYRFNGRIREADGMALCYVAVMISCFPPKQLYKTQSKEASDKVGHEVKRRGHPFQLYKTTCRIIDRSCRDEPMLLHIFSREEGGVPSPLKENEMRIIAVHKGRVSNSGRQADHYLSVSDYSSWVVCSLGGKIVEWHGKPFSPPPESLVDTLLWARGMQPEDDEEAMLEQAPRSNQPGQAAQMCELNSPSFAQEPQSPTENPNGTQRDQKGNEKDSNPSNALDVEL